MKKYSFVLVFFVGAIWSLRPRSPDNPSSFQALAWGLDPEPLHFPVIMKNYALDQLAFSSTRDGNNQIYLMDYPTLTVRRITEGPGEALYPTWSPDGSKLAFNDSGVTEIFTINRDGSGCTQLTDNWDLEIFPHWSPVGDQIAFLSTRDGSWDIFLMNSNGSNQVNVTNTPQRDELYVRWSPNGELLGFIAETEVGGADLFIRQADGSNEINLTNSPDVSKWTLCWSPDGNSIAYDSDQGGQSDLYRIDIDGTNLIRLINDVFADSWCSWSSDGARILYASSIDDTTYRSEIMLLDIAGGPPQNLTENMAWDVSPAWRP